MTDTLTIDLTRIPHLAERRRIAELWTAYERVQAEQHAAAKPYWDKRRALDEAVEARVQAIHAEHKAEYDSIDAEMQAAKAPFGEKSAVVWDQIEAFGEPGGGVLWWDDYSEFERCLLTGLPILSDDEVLETEDGDRILAVLVEKDVDSVEALGENEKELVS